MKKIARIFVIMFVSIIAIGVSVYANTASISLSTNNTQIEANSTMTVAVVASGSGQIRGGEFNVSISSSDFEIVSVTGAGSFSLSGSGGHYLAYNMSGGAAPSGSSIAVITIRAKAGTQAGATGTLNVTGSGIVIQGDEATTVPAGSSSKTFTVKAKASSIPKPVTGGNKTTQNNDEKNKAAEEKSKAAEEKNKANADLVSLTSEVASIPFNKDKLEYTINVDKTVGTLGLKALAKNSKAKVTITGDENFKIGNNIITIKVVSEDGKTTKVYTITVVKSKYGSGALSSLKIDKFKMSPNFDPSDLSYKVTIDGASEATKLELKYTATNPDAKVAVEGNEDFVVGKNIVTITVTEPDGKVTVYKIEVIKEVPALEKLNNISKKNTTIWLTIVIILSVLVVGEAVYIVIKKIKENKEEK
ncbi:MAG: cadherin-like beta sandwich domain-containing protein [Clostridia bacterium]|nr:cadherin-like beta sandwich domain-containing protein [Clostridia bacterium]MDD4375342.1 cadherin-like beta sandwich domain-containing protein [Clostridia bacterium]